MVAVCVCSNSRNDVPRVNGRGCYTLTRYILVGYSTVIYWRSPFVILGLLSLFCPFYSVLFCFM